MALLLLRAVVGFLLANEALSSFRDPDFSSGGPYLAAILLAFSALLIVGLLAPLAAVAMAVATLGTNRHFLPAASSTLLGSPVVIVLLETMLLVIVLQGAGAYSIDARVFGRREIIIPLPRE